MMSSPADSLMSSSAAIGRTVSTGVCSGQTFAIDLRLDGRCQQPEGCILGRRAHLKREDDNLLGLRIHRMGRTCPVATGPSVINANGSVGETQSFERALSDGTGTFGRVAPGVEIIAVAAGVRTCTGARTREAPEEPPGH